ncbi:MAG: phosphoribosylanthranilate isomerase [Pirellulales bacterium]|nr:phosphoribosylanthranilate isomerase [Pirellulales bacterium]
MFQIKICGVTSAEDARMVARAGADAVGLNFFPASPRYVAPERARPIIDALPGGVVKVALFVNPQVADAIDAVDRLGCDLIQLHGDEPPELLAELGDRPVLRAFRIGPEGLQPMAEYVQRCRQLDCRPKMVLIDTLIKGEYGGTGKVANWSEACRHREVAGLPPLVLAGGLRPDNVAEAIRAVVPAAVDTAGGVESSPGRKDPAAVEAFVRAARIALAEI